MVRQVEFGLKSLYFSNCVLQLITVKSAFCTFKCLIRAECKIFFSCRNVIQAILGFTTSPLVCVKEVI